MIDAIPDYTELPLGRFLDMVASREPAPAAEWTAALVPTGTRHQTVLVAGAAR